MSADDRERRILAEVARRAAAGDLRGVRRALHRGDADPEVARRLAPLLAAVEAAPDPLEDLGPLDPAELAEAVELAERMAEAVGWAAEGARRVAAGEGGPVEAAMLAAFEAILAGDPARALQHLRDARTAARTVGDTDAYLGAAVAEADILDGMGDRPAAYGSLAVAWRSLDQWFGEPAGRRFVAPAVEQLVARWGHDAYEDARRAYEATLA